jgi:hypothetical protein
MKEKRQDKDRKWKIERVGQESNGRDGNKLKVEKK